MNSRCVLDRFSFLFAEDGGFLRIPIWGHIPLSRGARRIVEHPSFVRLSKIRQLGLVNYVFPGASHTRFEHSVGTYHLSVLMLQRLILKDTEAPAISPEEAKVFLAAALLHDIGHYPFAHLIDRLPEREAPAFASHEDRAADYILNDPSISTILIDDWQIENPESVVRTITEPKNSGLPGRMLSGILDPDKMDYLMRDAWSCGVPYGNIDTDRLIEALAIDTSETGRRLGITEKGIAPLESLVFAKYMMFRHIYWHHAVRIAVAMFTRFVQDGLIEHKLSVDDFYRMSDDALIEHLNEEAGDVTSGELMHNLYSRNLYKRGITFFAEHAIGEDEFAISKEEFEAIRKLYYHPDVRREKEIAISKLLGLKSGSEVLLDIPRVDSVFDVADFEELRVLTTLQASGKQVFLPFNSYGFTQLTAEFAQSFERFSRRLQVICRPDIVETVRNARKEIKAVVTG